MKSLIWLFILPLAIGVLSAPNCFDNANIIPSSELLNFQEKSLKAIEKMPVTLNMLECFLAKHPRSGTEQYSTEKYFQIYKKCNEYLKNQHELIGMKQLYELKQLDLPNSLASLLEENIKYHSQTEIKDSVLYIVEKMEEYIEKSNEFQEYKGGILHRIEEEKNPKLKQSRTEDVTHFVQVAGLYKSSAQRTNLLEISLNVLIKYAVLVCGLMLF